MPLSAHCVGPRFVISAPTSAKQGSSIKFTVTVQDTYGNIVTDYAGKVRISRTDTKAGTTDYTFAKKDAAPRDVVELCRPPYILILSQSKRPPSDRWPFLSIPGLRNSAAATHRNGSHHLVLRQGRRSLPFPVCVVTLPIEFPGIDPNDSARPVVFHSL